MDIAFKQLELKKRYPLTISRGVSHSSVNLFLLLSRNGHTGIGEMAPGKLTGCASAAQGQALLQGFLTQDLLTGAIHDIMAAAEEIELPTCVSAALDIALWDLFARECGVPLCRLFGLAPRCVPTSITIGIESETVIRERVPEMLARTQARFLKIKLGSPLGLEADRAHFQAAAEAAQPFHSGLRVDANGGWSLDQAQAMLPWLAQHGVDFVEQPLHHEQDHLLPVLFDQRPLPLYVDESCCRVTDVPRWAHCVDGVNVKLMKSGGLCEAQRIVAAARAHKLKTMIGCMGESSIAISAGAAIGALFDHIDLDAHLNLIDDPAHGVPFIDGRLMPGETPGHGGQLKDA